MSADEKNDKNELRYKFKVDFGTELRGVEFQEVKGLDFEKEITEYRQGSEPSFTKRLVLITKYSDITLKRGVFKNSNSFWKWCSQIAMDVLDTVKRQTITIKLLVDKHEEVIKEWELANARLTKITSIDIKPDNKEIVIDTIEVNNKGKNIKND